jgi:transposase
MDAVVPIVRRRRDRQFRTMEEKRLIVEETRSSGVSVAAVAQAHGVNANQVFYWRKLYDAGQLESKPALPPRAGGAPGVRLLPVTVDEGAEQQAPVTVTASSEDHTAGRSPSSGTIELILAGTQVRIVGQVDAGTLRTVLRCLLA